MTDFSRRGVLLGGSAAIASTSVQATALRGSHMGAHVSAPAVLDDSEQRLLTMPDGQALAIQIAHPHPVEQELPLMIRGRKPVPIYVLDGWDNFAVVAGLVRTMQWGGSVPPCLVIGLGYADPVAADKTSRRRYDLTPNANGPIKDVRYGGSGPFRHFIGSIVKPMIERVFTVDAAQSTLVGHSLGGLFALETALKEPQLFANVLALSPSLWFDDHLLLRQWRAALKAASPFPHVVALAGDREETISPSELHMTRNVQTLGEAVSEARQSNRIFAGVLEDTTHHTILGPGLTFGLRKLLDPQPPSARAGLVTHV